MKAIPLSRPIRDAAGRPVWQLLLRDPHPGDELLKTGGVTASIAIIARLSGLPEAEIARLSPADMKAALEMMTPHLQAIAIRRHTTRK